MSQYNKSQKPITRHNSSKSRLSRWLWIGGGISIVILVIGLILIRNNGASAQNSVPIQVAGVPSLSVVQDTFDYGNVPLDTTIETVFRVQNVGDQPLTILNDPQAQVVEGCCPPSAVLSAKVIQPGQEATITLKFMMHSGLMGGQSMAGKHRFNIDLQTNDPTQPTKQLVILSNWV